MMLEKLHGFGLEPALFVIVGPCLSARGERAILLYRHHIHVHACCLRWQLLGWAGSSHHVSARLIPYHFPTSLALGIRHKCALESPLVGSMHIPEAASLHGHGLARSFPCCFLGRRHLLAVAIPCSLAFDWRFSTLWRVSGKQRGSSESLQNLNEKDHVRTYVRLVGRAEYHDRYADFLKYGRVLRRSFEERAKKWR